MFLDQGKKYSLYPDIPILLGIWKIAKFASSYNDYHYSVWKPYS